MDRGQNRSAATLGAPLGQVHREAFEVGERAIVQSSFVRSPQDYAQCLARFGTNDRRASSQSYDSGVLDPRVMQAEQCGDLIARVLKIGLGGANRPQKALRTRDQCGCVRCHRAER